MWTLFSLNSIFILTSFKAASPDVTGLSKDEISREMSSGIEPYASQLGLRLGLGLGLGDLMLYMYNRAEMPRVLLIASSQS